MKFELLKVKNIFFHLDFALSSKRELAAFSQMPICLFCSFILFLFVFFFFYCKSTAYVHYLLFEVTKAYNFSFLNRKLKMNSNIGQPTFVKTKFKATYMEEGVKVCGIAVLGYFWCGFAVIFISKYGIAVFKVQAVCGNFKFYVAVIGEKIVVSRWSSSWVLSFLKHDNYAILKEVLKGPKRS